MPRGDQVTRLYRLVMDLARTKHGITAAALARRRELPVRTVYRGGGGPGIATLVDASASIFNSPYYNPNLINFSVVRNANLPFETAPRTAPPQDERLVGLVFI
jgi:hypothetical protein